ncbi:hypothetical protein [Fodinicola feengrottensis]
MTDEPPSDVRAAFGVSGVARRLPGGGGNCWQIGDVLLKPGHHPVVGAWQASVFANLTGPGFRVPRPIRSADGSWIVDSWAAWTRVAGEPAPLARWPALVATSRAFHAALDGVAAPRWLGRGRNRWAVADRVAWGETTVEVAPELAELVTALQDAEHPIGLPSQLVHGDIAGNVLFAAEQPPAVIDFSPYWRPAGFALAVAAVDLLVWSQAPAAILDELADEPGIDQLLLRALVYRLVTESLGGPDPESREAVRRANEPVVDLLLSRLSGRPPTTVLLTDKDLRDLAGGALGAELTRLRPVTGGHTGAVCRIADRAGGGSVFVKAANPAARTELNAELDVYESLGSRPYLPRVLATSREPVPLLALESLSPQGWVRAWTPDLVDATEKLLDQVHSSPASTKIPRLRAAVNPWDVIAADPQRLLRLDICSSGWLDAHLGAVRAAAQDAPVEGDQLIHRDVRAANLWADAGRLVLVDWASAAIGDPWLDRHLWLVALHAEGGPPPESRQGPHAAGHAALIAGQQPLLTPARESNPALFDLRRQRLAVALAWSARLLSLPSFS